MDERPGRPQNVPPVLWQLGDVFLPEPVRDYLDKSYGIYGGANINNWSFVHMFSGFLTRKLGFTANEASTIHVLWEMFQVSISMTDLEKEGEVQDVIADTLFFEFGSRVLNENIN